MRAPAPQAAIAAPAPAADSNARRLGDNPRVAQALRAMAQRDGGSNSTRDHFRSVLAEAAGLMDESAARPAQSQPMPSAAGGQRAAAVHDRLPVSEEYGLKTSTDRGQFLDLGSQSAPQRQPRETRANAQEGANLGGANFERLIR